MSRLPSLGPRGEGWVVAQGIVLAAVAAAGAIDNGAWRFELRAVTTVLSLALASAGLLLAGGGLRGLDENLTPLPRPRADGRLVDSGPYRLVRHPIYGGLVLLSFAWGLLVASPAALVASTGLLGFFDLKSRREEAWLEIAYPDYGAYRLRTRRLIPYLY